LDCRAI